MIAFLAMLFIGSCGGYDGPLRPGLFGRPFFSPEDKDHFISERNLPPEDSHCFPDEFRAVFYKYLNSTQNYEVVVWATHVPAAGKSYVMTEEDRPSYLPDPAADWTHTEDDIVFSFLHSDQNVKRVEIRLLQIGSANGDIVKMEFSLHMTDGSVITAPVETTLTVVQVCAKPV